MTPEGRVVAACLRYLELRGIVAWRANTGALVGEYKGKRRFVRFGIKGMADIQGVLGPDGRAFFCECKAGQNKQTEEQQAFQDAVEKRGALYVLAYSVNDLIEALEHEKDPQA